MTKGRVANVLVIDDEPQLRELLADALAAPDLEITLASSGKEALEKAREHKPDLVIADLYLGDCTGLEVIDELRKISDSLPAVVITGRGDVDNLLQASRRRPVELMTKPLDLDRLRNTIRQELVRQDKTKQQSRRARRLRRLAKEVNKDRKEVRRQFHTACEDLTTAYRNLSSQMAIQHVAISYQNMLLSASTDDDVFRSLFRLFVQRSGPIYGVAMVCDSNTQLNVIGRFGVPLPDSVEFCNALTEPLIEAILIDPKCILIDAGEQPEMFDESIQRYLPGLSILLIPLIPAPGELIGMVALYRKGEQPFTEDDVVVAEMVAGPTAIAVRRND